MKFLNKHGILARVLGIILSIAILLTSIPLLNNIIEVDGAEVEVPNLVTNGSFDDGLNGWQQNWSDFTVVKASDEGLNPIDGDNIMKIVTATKWAWREQYVNVAPNTDYEYTFWLYRPDATSNAVYKLGTSSNNTIFNPNSQQTYLDNEAIGVWIKKRVVFNSGENTSVKLVFCAHIGTAYIDNVSLRPITNYIQNGGFEEGLTGWSGSNAEFSVIDATDDNLVANQGNKILKVDLANGTKYANRSQTATLKTNTNYLLTMWVYQPNADSKLIIKLGTPSSHNEFSPSKSDYNVWQKGKPIGEWFKLSFTFNTGANIDFKLHLVVSGGTTYIDNIRLQKALNVTVTEESGGSIIGKPNGTVYTGDMLSLTAVPEEDFEFDGWYEGENKISADEEYKFIAYTDRSITAKFKSKEYEIIKNGSFEDDFASWSSSGTGFSTMVSGTDEITANDGNKILKADLANGTKYANKSQTATLDTNTNYLFSMWVYQPDADSKLILKLGTPSSHNEFSPNKVDYNIWEKNNKKGEWFNITILFNSGDNIDFITHIVISGGITYVDNISLKRIVNVTTSAEGGRVSGLPNRVLQGDKITLTAEPDMGYLFDGWYVENNKVSTDTEYKFIASVDYNLVAKFTPKVYEILQNGGFEEGLTAWTGSNAEFSVIDAADDNLVANQGNKILKVDLANGTKYANRSQTATLETNTNYLLSMWVYQPDANSKLLLKLGTPSSHNEFSPSKSDYNVWQKGKPIGEWFKLSFVFNSGANIDFKMHIVVSGGTTYVDNISLKKVVEITTIAENGTVSGLPEKILQGDIITLTAEPDTGYVFKGWYVGETKVSFDNEYSFVADANCTIAAKFNEKEYGIILNGSFADGFDSWSGNGTGFYIVDPIADGITVKEDNQVLKADLTSGSRYASKLQTATMETNTDYVFSMLVYQPDSASNLILKLGTPSNHNEFLTNKEEYKIWYNHETKGQWFEVKIPFNSGDNTDFIMHLVISGGITYVDNISLKKVVNVTTVAQNGTALVSPGNVVLEGDRVTITAVPDLGYVFDGWYVTGNKISQNSEYSFVIENDCDIIAKFVPKNYEILQNGGFEEGLTAWTGSNAEFSVIDAADDNLVANQGNKILKVDLANGTKYANRSQTATLETNTNYLLSMWVYQPDANSKLILKLGTTSSHNEFSPSKSDYNVWQTHNTQGQWLKITIPFNSNDNTDFKMHFVVSGGITYIDNVSLKKVIKVSTIAEGGTIFGLPDAVLQGEQVTLLATPDIGNVFDGWYIDDNKVSNSTEYNFIAYNDCEITAKFSPQDFEIIKNGSFEENLKSWSGSGSGFSVIDAIDDQMVANDGEKILKAVSTSGTELTKKSQTATVDKNTDYLFSMWVYQPDANSKLALKLGTSSSENEFSPNKNSYNIWENNSIKGQWFKVNIPFNSGENTEFKIQLVLNGGVIYADNVSLKKIVNITTIAQGGTISGIPEYVLQGDKVTLTAVPDAGYAFEGWYKDDVRVAGTSSYTFYAVVDCTLQAKFEDAGNAIKNGSFETGNFVNWDATSDFEVVDGGKDNAPDAMNGSKIVKVTSSAQWRSLSQFCDIEKNTNYILGFWYYRTADSQMTVKVGNNANDDGLVSVKWLNWDWLTINEWHYVTFKFNSGDSDIAKLFLMTFQGEFYLDDISLRRYYEINISTEGGGLVSGLSDKTVLADTPIVLKAEPYDDCEFEGWFENNIKISSETELKFNATNDRTLVAKFSETDNFIFDSGFERDTLYSGWINPWDRGSVSKDEAYEGEQSLHFAKTDMSNYPYLQYKIFVKPNTNYIIKFMVKIPKGSTAPLLQALGANNVHLLNERDMTNNNFFANGGGENAPGKGWLPVTATFNSGDNTAVKIAFTGNKTAEAYIDNLIVGEAFTATITAGEHGKVAKTQVLGLKNALTTLTAIPDKDYMVEGWYIDGEKVSSEKNYNHLFTKDIAIEVRFTISDLPIMTDFNSNKLWCSESDNLLNDSSFELGTGAWNTSSFIKNGVLDVVEIDGENVLYFNPDDKGRQVVYFPVSLAANTNYMFSANVRGKYYSATNKMDMSFGIMTKDGEYIILENPRNGGYYDETPNVTFTKSITPPSWDNNWHRRGIIFRTVAATTVWIAVSGNLSEAYLDDFILCEYENAIPKPDNQNLAKRTSVNVPENRMGCDENDNLIENYSFNEGSNGWEDGYGWEGYYSGVYIGDSGNENKSLFMRSTTGYADRHYYIKWIDLKPNTEYTFSVAAAATSFESNYGLLVKGEKHYSKIVSWTADSDSNWGYNAITFNSNDSTQIGVYIMDGGRVTALDDIRLFETSNATAIETKLSGKADLPDELIIPPDDSDDSSEDNGDSSKDNTSFEETDESSKEQEEEQTTKKKVIKKKKVVKKLKNGNDYFNIWWIIGGIGGAILLAGGIVFIIILMKKKRKRG